MDDFKELSKEELTLRLEGAYEVLINGCDACEEDGKEDCLGADCDLFIIRKMLEGEKACPVCGALTNKRNAPCDFCLPPVQSPKKDTK